MNTRFFSLVVALSCAFLYTPAMAQGTFGAPVGFQQCFYECKLDPSGANRYVEVTSLMIANGRQPIPGGPLHPTTHVAELVVLDGNERIRLVTETRLSARDLDEINVCATLDEASNFAAPPPSAGNIQVVIYDVTPDPMLGANPVDIWMKNVIGRMNRLDPEPFNGRVTGVGKVGCENIEDAPELLLEDPQYAEAPRGRAVLIERTEDPEPSEPDLIVRLVNPPTTVSCPGGQGTCVHDVDLNVREINGVNIANSFTVTVKTDNALSTSFAVPGIAGGTALGFSATLGPGNNCYNPDCEVTAEVDSGDDVGETDETNNTDSRLDLG